jgi:hypothetical protein
MGAHQRRQAVSCPPSGPVGRPARAGLCVARVARIVRVMHSNYSSSQSQTGFFLTSIYVRLSQTVLSLANYQKLSNKPIDFLNSQASQVKSSQNLRLRK